MPETPSAPIAAPQRSWVGPPDSLDEALCAEVVKHALWLVNERQAIDFQLSLARFLEAAKALRDHRR